MPEEAFGWQFTGCMCVLQPQNFTKVLDYTRAGGDIFAQSVKNQFNIMIFSWFLDIFVDILKTTIQHFYAGLGL